MKKIKTGDYLILNDDFGKPIRSCLVISATRDELKYYVLEDQRFHIVRVFERDYVI